MEIFDVFGIMLGERFFGITDLLSSSLQGKNVTACDAKAASDTVCYESERRC